MKNKIFVALIIIFSFQAVAEWNYEFRNYHHKRSFYIDTESVIKDKEFISVDMLADFPERPKVKTVL